MVTNEYLHHMRITFFFLLLSASILFLSNKGGRNQPCSGAPFENNSKACSECHSGGNYTPAIALVVKDSLGNTVDSYIPGNTYNLEMAVSSTTGNPKAYGFQAVIVDGNNAQAGSFVTLGEKVRKLTLQNRTYLTQISPLASGIFTAKWKAPGTASDLKLYMSGVAVNSNSSTGGDKATTASFNINPSTISANHESDSEELAISVNGNKVSWNIEAKDAIIMDAGGKTVARASGQEIILPSATPGFYILLLEIDGRHKSFKFVL